MDVRMRRVIVLLNSGSGSATAPGQVGRTLQSAGLDADVRAVAPSDLKQAARSAASERPDAVVASGGDGTISAVAGALAGSPIPLGVLPAGTLNHFARDLGLPAEFSAAAHVIAAGRMRSIDLGSVNGSHFVNNSSIGLYPLLVRYRDRQRRWRGLDKWAAMLSAVLWALRRFPLVHVTLEASGNTVRCKTPLVFVGNNQYAIDLLNLGRRTALDRGELCVYLVNASTRLRFLRLAVRIILGRLKQDRDFITMCVTRLRIEAKREKLHVACDGEVTEMQPPLIYESRPGALKVLAP